MSTNTDRIDIDKPRWDQNTFMGRFKRFFNVTNPMNGLHSDKELFQAKELVEAYRENREPPGTTLQQIRQAKTIYDSAFHPDSGDLMNVIGRMSFQVPGGMIITGCMLQWYRTMPAVVFWQWINQSFNALANYTNRNAKSPISTTQLGAAYVSATSAAVATALALNSLTKRARPVVARLVPFAAVAAANCVNIPLMRQRELLDGIIVTDQDGNNIGESKVAARKAISQVCVSRITMAAPGMTFLPFFMERFDKTPFMKRFPFLGAPIQTFFVGMFLIVMTPAACAIFPQKSSLQTDKLESQLQEIISKKYDNSIEKVYFNKGL
ncbi:Sideroflexin-1 [Trichoplax sp. H2]|uniref:Sidoreflexin n=1 Tax=Trichoplax adhaerens TaxID=10228 RepID=B3S974_TRIAD|nr:hypothetical protein TRIADDRAFT_31398 [Trichoplax adhaerens]EDV20753.1 hypothetical protein TRIADDRAFT_31398 [Trichoplax adhaerens]RDD36697.1 Sideroflexin-1 [Trichoplax sp. H2]|eukprot:XP_002116694.1 hypothetical protein TRIADDRAFT_31398 [Trichoplax adhaerens]